MANQLAQLRSSVVDIISPGFAPTRTQIQTATDFCRKMGVTPRLPKNMLGPDLLCSNTDQERWQHLQRALETKDSSLIWCLRGGYGCVRLLDNLETWWKKHKRKAQPKVLWGLSDVTSLHLFWNGVMGWPSIHGPLLNMLDSKVPTFMEAEAESLVRSAVPSLTFGKLTPLNNVKGAASKKSRVIQAPVTGGNLTVFTSHIGTRFANRVRNPILFFEDIGERGYRIDRMLMQLTLAGVFDQASAVIFGTFKECKEPDGREIWQKVIERWAQTVNIPVFTGLPSGHETPCRSLIFGMKSELIISTNDATLVQRIRSDDDSRTKKKVTKRSKSKTRRR